MAMTIIFAPGAVNAGTDITLPLDPNDPGFVMLAGQSTWMEMGTTTTNSTSTNLVVDNAGRIDRSNSTPAAGHVVLTGPRTIRIGDAMTAQSVLVITGYRKGQVQVSSAA